MRRSSKRHVRGESWVMSKQSSDAVQFFWAFVGVSLLFSLFAFLGSCSRKNCEERCATIGLEGEIVGFAEGRVCWCFDDDGNPKRPPKR